jgi:hypothetical protein
LSRDESEEDEMDVEEVEEMKREPAAALDVEEVPDVVANENVEDNEDERMLPRQALDPQLDVNAAEPRLILFVCFRIASKETAEVGGGGGTSDQNGRANDDDGNSISGSRKREKAGIVFSW